MRLILASTSPYRRSLLERLGIPFDTISPDIDETPIASESAEALARRLAIAKARAGLQHLGDASSGALVLGSDQCAVLDDEILGKPGNRTANIEQLMRASGKTVRFFTGLCLTNGATSRERVEVVPFEVEFIDLDRRLVEAYVDREGAHDCAGGFRCEALGVALFKRMSGDDPNALVGLPLIALCRMLRLEGVEPLAPR
ncbi:MAG: Maf family protein [Gammaproteobacteria bacterium]